MARGYYIRTSPPGAGGGVDILAGQGLMGFDPPRLALQVNSGDSPMDTTVLHQLLGAMKNVDADQGLLVVALGGFKRTVLANKNAHFFNVRLWHAQRLLNELRACYDLLSDEWRRRIPLKRLWILDPGGTVDAGMAETP